MVEHNLVVASNRGPMSFKFGDDGELRASRAGGGLAATLAPAVAGSGATWVAAAISDADRRAAENGTLDTGRFRLRLLSIDPDRYRAYYYVVANATLWYLYHGLFDRPRRPRFDRPWRDAWKSYREVNHAFATAVADVAPDGATVLVQDYQLSLLGSQLSRERPDLRTVHFHHTPFCGPDDVRLLPDEAAGELLESLAAHRACGFHSRRWARNFEQCCQDVLGSTPRTFLAPAAADAAGIREVAASEECAAALRRLDERVGDCRVIVRVDRIELSKNLLRGFHAFDDLLRNRPEWRQQVVMAALIYPSREGLADYLAYRLEVEGLVERINSEWSTPSWTPILLDTSDNFASSVAALRRYDALLVNPVRDGLNLVAKEGPIVNEHDGVVVLSRASGVWDEIGEWTLGVNPFDVAGTADGLHAALSMGPGERAQRAASLRAAAERRNADDWLADQLAALSP